MTDEYTLTVQREIAAPAEVLFDAWLDPRSLGTWLKPYGPRASRAETDPRVGGAFRIVMVDGDAAISHTGTYHEIDRPRRLVFSWNSPGTQFRDSIVTVTFEPARNDSTLVAIHQVGLPDEQARAAHHGGWTDILEQLGRTHDNKKETA
jgi:uncharacterized protein YndB with AHSA1/START domain